MNFSLKCRPINLEKEKNNASTLMLMLNTAIAENKRIRARRCANVLTGRIQRINYFLENNTSIPNDPKQ
jgi:hypothetical protein